MSSQINFSTTKSFSQRQNHFLCGKNHSGHGKIISFLSTAKSLCTTLKSISLTAKSFWSTYGKGVIKWDYHSSPLRKTHQWHDQLNTALNALCGILKSLKIIRKSRRTVRIFSMCLKELTFFFSGKTPHRSGQVQGSHGERFSTIGSSF